MEYIKKFLHQCDNCRNIQTIFHMRRVFHMKYQVQGLICEKCFEEQDNFVKELSPYIMAEEIKLTFN